MAFNYVGSLKALLARGDFPSESSLFRLHYQFTTAICIGGSIFLTANEFFGETINCMTDLDGHVINTYCWIKSTFTMDDYHYRWDHLIIHLMIKESQCLPVQDKKKKCLSHLIKIIDSDIAIHHFMNNSFADKPVVLVIFIGCLLRNAELWWMNFSTCEFL